jgi:hypothetical protein
VQKVFCDRCHEAIRPVEGVLTTFELTISRCLQRGGEDGFDLEITEESRKDLCQPCREEIAELLARAMQRP